MNRANIIQCSHIDPARTPYGKTIRCNNDSLPNRAFCEEHRDEEAWYAYERP